MRIVDPTLPRYGTDLTTCRLLLRMEEFYASRLMSVMRSVP